MKRNNIKSVGIIGSGKMGTDIFFYLLQFNFSLIWICRSSEKKNYLEKKINKKIKRLIKSGIVNDSEENKLNEIIISVDLNKLKKCDLIIESIIEDINIKKDLFRKIDIICDNDTIFSSNSSSIIPSKLFCHLKRNKNFLNIHFFYPLKLVNIAEIIKTEFLNEDILDIVKIFLKEINKKFIVLDEKNGFILNKIFLIIQAECFNIQKEYNLSFKTIDEMFYKIFPNGIFKFIDNVGIEVIRASVNEYIEDFKNIDFFKNMTDVLENENELYSYEFDEKILSKFNRNKIEERIIFLLINIYYLTIEKNICNSNELEFALKEYLMLDKSPVKLCREFGKKNIFNKLNILYRKYKYDYYKPSKFLK